MRHSLGRATPRALGYLPTVNSIKADQLRIVLLSFPYLFTPRSSLLYHILRQTLLVNLVQAHSRIYPFPSHTSNPQVNQLRHYLPRSLKLIHLYQVTRPGHTKSYIQTHCTDDSGRPQTSTITGSLLNADLSVVPPPRTASRKHYVLQSQPLHTGHVNSFRAQCAPRVLRRVERHTLKARYGE